MEHLVSATLNSAVPSFWRSLCVQGSILGKLDQFFRISLGLRRFRRAWPIFKESYSACG
jgi:hypothetical protein